MIFLVDLMVPPISLDRENVPLLLQAVIVLWDHYTPLIQDQAREMLVHLIHELVITKIEDDTTVPNKKRIETFVESIRKHDSSVLWVYDELDGKDPEEDSKYILKTKSINHQQVPIAMIHVTDEVCNLFAIEYPQIREQCAKLCLTWATTCPVRHVACRSLQVFRCISTTFDSHMLSEILARLSNTIVDKGLDVQIFSIEILTTLRIVIGGVSPAELLKYPQIFWTACACLDTIYEREFMTTLQLLEKILEKLDLSNTSVILALEKAKPQAWKGSFDGISPLVYKGLKSDASLSMSLRILRHLMSIPDNDLVGTRDRLLFGTLASLPTFLYSFEDPTKRTECMEMAQMLAPMAERQGATQLSMTMEAFASRRIVTEADLLTQALLALSMSFFPALELKALIFLIGLLTNRLHWYKVKTLDILQVMIQDVDTRRTEIASQGPDLISPLLRLLQTEYCDRALKVMDHIMVMSETPMSRQHYRMSFVGSGPRSTRQAYDKTQSLYGIPEATGWSIPAPATHTSNCRSNMHAVYMACAQAGQKAQHVPTPEVEFHADEDHGSYFPTDTSGTLTSQHSLADSGVGSMESGMGDLLTKLNSLDDFFDDPSDAFDDTNRFSSVTITPYNQDLDTRPDLFDRQMAPSLHQSLSRTGSTSSIRNDGDYHDRHHEQRLAPSNGTSRTAFKATTEITSSSAIPQRPGLHSRSVTSPANNLTKTSNSVKEIIPDEEAEETFSEDERSTGYTGAGARMLGSTSLRGAQSSIRKMAPGLEGKDYKQRGLLRAQSRSKNQSPNSPQVPKVPEAYLQPQQQHPPPPGLRPSDTF